MIELLIEVESLLPSKLKANHLEDCIQYVLLSRLKTPRASIPKIVSKYVLLHTKTINSELKKSIRQNTKTYGDFEKIELCLDMDTLPRRLRLIAYMILLGFTPKEIAEEFDKSEAWVRQQVKRMAKE